MRFILLNASQSRGRPGFVLAIDSSLSKDEPNARRISRSV
jgi:hypothetical protein